MKQVFDFIFYISLIFFTSFAISHEKNTNFKAGGLALGVQDKSRLRDGCDEEIQCKKEKDDGERTESQCVPENHLICTNQQ